MTCPRCIKARSKLSEAVKAAMKGDVRRAGAEVLASAVEVAGKIKGALAKPE